MQSKALMSFAVLTFNGQSFLYCLKMLLFVYIELIKLIILFYEKMKTMNKL